jgi:hypothetical protein
MTKEETWVRSCLGKKRYGTLTFVEKMVIDIKTKRGIDLYFYPCASCQGYHLTKRSKRLEIG